MDANLWQTCASPAMMLARLKPINYVRQRFLILHAFLGQVAYTGNHDWGDALPVLAQAADKIEYMETAEELIRYASEVDYVKDFGRLYDEALRQMLEDVLATWWSEQGLTARGQMSNLQAMLHVPDFASHYLDRRERRRYHQYFLEAQQRQCNAIRDIARNPCLPGPPWIGVELRGLAGKAVYDLAACMYHDGEQSPRLPLSDALEELGCTNTEILGHLRQQSFHNHGCWVVDLILGKTWQGTPV